MTSTLRIPRHTNNWWSAAACVKCWMAYKEIVSGTGVDRGVVVFDIIIQSYVMCCTEAKHLLKEPQQQGFIAITKQLQVVVTKAHMTDQNNNNNTPCYISCIYGSIQLGLLDHFGGTSECDVL